MPDAEVVEAEPVVEAQPVEAVAEPQTPEQIDAALDAQITEQAIDLPDGTDKLVPLSAVTNAREIIKTLRSELATLKPNAERATALESRIAEVQQQLNSALPLAQAYQAAVESQTQTAEPTGPTQAERAELEDIARDYDFYKTDGALDLERATKHQARIRKEATAIAQQQIAPMQAQTVRSQSHAMLASALATKGPNGVQPDPEIVKAVWARLDPSVTATKEGAIQAWNVALGYSVNLGKAVGGPAAKAREPVPAPLITERAGGRDSVAPVLTDSDKKAAREMGMSEKDYAEEVAKMPWGRR